MEIQEKQINIYKKGTSFKTKFKFSWAEFGDKTYLFPSGYMDFKKAINRGFYDLIIENDITENKELRDIYYRFKSSIFRPRKHITYAQGRKIADGMKKARDKKKMEKKKAIEEINNMFEWL